MFVLRHQLIKVARQSVNITEKYSSIRCVSNSSTDDKSTNDTTGQSSNQKDKENKNDVFGKQLMVRGYFENIADKNKNSYLRMVEIFINRDIRRRNHVEFIYAALQNMEEFGVNKDLEVYKALMNVLPKEKFIPRNMIQAEFMHYPKQQQCIIDLLDQMEDNGVMPDFEMQDILLNTFGRRGHPTLKYWRMMYWMPKFKNKSPWLLPNPVPNDALELAKLAVAQMCTIDLQSKVVVFNTNEVESSIDDTWIVSGMSPEQSKLLAKHPVDVPLRVEGPFIIWQRNKTLNYFILRGDPTELNYVKLDNDDVTNLKVTDFGWTTSLTQQNRRSVHQQRDGTIYAICATGTSTKDSLLSWIRLLEQNGNECLGNLPVLFKLRTQVQEEQLISAE